MLLAKLGLVQAPLQFSMLLVVPPKPVKVYIYKLEICKVVFFHIEILNEQVSMCFVHMAS